MRIAYVLRRLSFHDWGGTETVVWETAKQLQANGHDVQILCTQALCTQAEEVRDGLRIRRLPYWYPNFPMGKARRDILDRKGGNPYAPALRRILEQEPFDLIHVHAMGRLSQMALAVSRRRGIPCVLSLHGGSANVPAAERASLVAPLRHTFPYGGILDRLIGYRKPLPEAMDGVICVGLDEAELLQKRHPTLHTCYLPNGTHVTQLKRPLHIDRTPIFAQYGVEAQGKLVLCVARIDEQKNQLMLVHWLSRRRALGEQITLVLAGAITQEAYADTIRQQAESLGIAQYLHITGALPPKSKALCELYHAADAFILPSRHEPFGIVVLEAWAAGVPVLCSSCGGLGRLVATGHNALTFDSGDDAGLDQAWESLIHNDELQTHLVAAGADAVKAYDWSVITQQLELFYQKTHERATYDNTHA